jgi:hypothetical protein
MHLAEPALQSIYIHHSYVNPTEKYIFTDVHTENEHLSFAALQLRSVHIDLQEHDNIDTESEQQNQLKVVFNESYRRSSRGL